MRILLHDNSISERGTSTSTVNYARALRDLCGHDVFLTFDRNSPGNNQRVIDHLSQEFELLGYESLGELNRQARNVRAEVFYAQKAGGIDGVVVDSALNVMHAVFRAVQPHGHRYAYVSKWLAHHATVNPIWRAKGITKSILHGHFRAATRALAPRFPWVPLIVPESTPGSSLRETLGIPEEAFVVGTLSGSGDFNLDFVRAWIAQSLNRLDDYYFVFPNLTPFIDHPRALFIPTLIGQAHKADYLATIDVLLHGRQLGESFGLAICEALSAGLPVMSWRGGTDRHHVQLLRGSGWMYSNAQDLSAIAGRLRQSRPSPQAAVSLVERFRPSEVIEIFEDVFLR